MTTTNTTTTYELRVAGHLDDHWAATLGDLTLTRHGDGTTCLTGPIVDQAQLHGVLARVRDLGVPLLTLHTLDGVGPSAKSTPAAVRPTLAGELRTERLTLRPGTSGDAEVTWAYRRLETVSEWLTETPTGLEAYRATFTDPDRLASTVIVELDGAVMGDFMLRIEDAWAQAEVADQARGSQAEIGWVLDPVHTGHGYATEAVRGLLQHCFTELGVRRVVANCFLANTTSWRLMERVGMRRESHAVAESLHRSGQWLDTLTYALLVTEWTAPRPAVHRRPPRTTSQTARTSRTPTGRGTYPER
jgi:RimJ/RimL family protein N-acetyltransferase